MNNNSETMKIYGTSVAVYTGKIEGYLRAKGLDYELEEVGISQMKHVEKMTGLHRVPAIDMKDGQWLSDSHLIIEYLEKKHPEPAIYLSDPLAQFFSLMLEEYFDEWIWLQCIYMRFCDADGGDYMINSMARSIMREITAPQFVKRWVWRNNRRKYLKEIGAGDENAHLLERRFLILLEQLEAIFSVQPYLLGERPTVADFGLFGPMFRHFVGDPYSGAIVRDKGPASLEWSARLWNIKPETFRDAPEPIGLNPAVKPLLVDFNDCFVPYLQANYQAFLKGKEHTHYTDLGEQWTRTTVPHRVWSIAKLQRSYQTLPQSAKDALNNCGYLNETLALMESTINTGDYTVPEMPITAS